MNSLVRKINLTLLSNQYKKESQFATISEYSDEECIIYESYGYQTENGDYEVKFNGRLCKVPIYNLKDYDPLNSKEVRVILAYLKMDIPTDEKVKQRFRELYRYVQADGISGQPLNVTCSNSDDMVTVITTNKPYKGYFEGSIKIKLSDGKPPKYVEIVAHKNDDGPPGVGKAFIIPPGSTIIVCDIDQTLKDTGVHYGKREMVKKTFFEEPISFPDMEKLLHHWADDGNYIFYMSNSPILLLSLLKDFIGSKFPPGPILLRDYKNIVQFAFGDKFHHKYESFQQLFSDFKDAKFVFLGDNAEGDPKLFRILATENPDKVRRMLIRNVIDSSEKKQMEKTFQEMVIYFESGEEIMDIFA